LTAHEAFPALIVDPYRNIVANNRGVEFIVKDAVSASETTR
jgi:hypothetical protein